MFRIKIALLSACVSGIVLVGFGIYLLTVISAVSMERIDREINALGESQLHVWHSKKHWEDLEGSLRSIYGPDRWSDLIVRATDADHQLLYESPHWPAAVKAAAFQGFDPQMEKGPRPGADGGDVPERTLGSPPRPREEPPHQPPREMRRPPAGFDQDRAGRPPEPGASADAAMRIKKPVFGTFTDSTGAWRVGIMGNQHVTILLGMNMAGYYSDADRFKRAFYMVLPLALLSLLAGGWLIAQRALTPVAVITRTVQRITARALDQRVPEGNADSELLNLVRTINGMLDRLEKSYKQATRFSADAAHELQTPLSVLQGILDEAVQHSPTESDEQLRYGSLLEEVQRLKTIVRKLLILARADASQLLLHRGPIDFSALVRNTIEDASALKADARIEAHVAPDIVLQGDGDLMRLALQELTKNATKYNLEGGVLRYNLVAENDAARLTIENSAHPMLDEDRGRIFERFYRADKSKSRIPGTGLGLSLAREIIKAHQGILRLEPAKPGLIGFSLRLPLGCN